MARRVRSRRFSKRMASGLIFLLTGIVGGFVTSVGMDVYRSLKSAVLNQNGFPVNATQLLFLLIGLAGLGLLLSGVIEPSTARQGVKKRS